MKNIFKKVKSALSGLISQEFKMKQMLKKELSIKGGLMLFMEGAGLAFVMAASWFTLLLIANLPFVSVS